MTKVWDVAIVGGGGAGMTAAVYSSRAGHSAAIFESAVAGGQIAIAGLVENYPGFPEGIMGADLAMGMRKQAETFGSEFISQEITAIRPCGGKPFELTAASGEVHRAAAVIVTAGAHHKKLNVPGEEDFTGRGVSYCATCDGAFFRDMDVAVVGGGDAAIDEGLFLTRFAKSVKVIHRRDELRAGHILQERAFANPKMEFIWNTVVESVEGTEGVESLQVRNTSTDQAAQMAVTGLFVFIGHRPNSGVLHGLVPLDAGGHAIVDLQMKTDVPGLFVAGDVRSLAVRQLVSACGDGATAAIGADRYLAEAALTTSL